VHITKVGIKNYRCLRDCTTILNNYPYQKILGLASAGPFFLDAPHDTFVMRMTDQTLRMCSCEEILLGAQR
jgi:hypothetical protein